MLDECPEMPVCAQQAPATLRALTQLDESHARVVEVINDVRSLTEREVLACGNVLSAIVENAMHLTRESESSLASSEARSEEINSRFVNGMREDILAQTTAVQRVLDLAKGIEAAVIAINDLTVSSRVLAINARIEAARLGEQGKGFAVIADNLSLLSKSIRATSEKVSSAIDSVREGLQPVSARAVSMDDRTKIFVEEVAAQVHFTSMQADSCQPGGRLTALTELSNQALSHLQFQDPMAQKLSSITSELKQAKERVRQSLKGEEEFSVTGASESICDEPLAGEVMLF
jgi:methyl-accepting chemotaxis protein